MTEVLMTLLVVALIAQAMFIAYQASKRSSLDHKVILDLHRRISTQTFSEVVQSSAVEDGTMDPVSMNGAQEEYDYVSPQDRV